MLAEFPFPPRCRYIMQSGSLCSLPPFPIFQVSADDGDALKIDDHHARLWRLRPTDGRARSLARQLRVMALVKEAAMTATAATERPFRLLYVKGRAGTRCDTFRDVLKLIRRDERTLRGTWELGSFLQHPGLEYHPGMLPITALCHLDC